MYLHGTTGEGHHVWQPLELMSEQEARELLEDKIPDAVWSVVESVGWGPEAAT